MFQDNSVNLPPQVMMILLISVQLKEVFLEIPQNSQENNWTWVFFW